MHMGNPYFKLVIYTTIMNEYWRQRKLIDYCEKLAVEGEGAIETLD